MTTAHRPTWKAAYGLSDSVGKGYIPTRSYSARDLPGYLKLKQRQWGQGSVDELKQKDFKTQLLKRQAQAKKKKLGSDIQIIEDIEPGKRQRVQQIDWISSIEPEKQKRILKPDQRQEVEEEEQQSQQQNPFPEDADSEQFIKQAPEQKKKKRIASDDDDQDDDDDEDQDDNQELLRAYQMIKQQRQKQELQRREQKHRESVANRQAELLKGNPLIDSSYSISKRWYQDTVFRNQAKKVEEKKTFINDYVRSDFHRKFMNRYVMR